MVEIFVHEHVGDGAVVAVVVGVIIAGDDDTDFAAVLPPFELSSLMRLWLL